MEDYRRKLARINAARGFDPTRTTVDRFLDFVSPEPNTGCWLWNGPEKCQQGYGSFQLERRKAVRASRASYMLLRGPIPKGLLVCHRCDMPECVNPDHLFLGTQLDNMRDAKNKGRLANRVRLKPEQVVAIRASQANCAQLARSFGVSRSAILDIRKGRTWKSFI